MLKNKTIVLAVTGSIAAYKIANLASMLKKLHADVQVLMTQNATNFINPITFETLTGNKCLVDTFDRNFQYSVEHVGPTWCWWLPPPPMSSARLQTVWRMIC